MRRVRHSMGYALQGLSHAFAREKNLKLFTLGYVVVMGIGAVVRLLPWEWVSLITVGGLFYTCELLNTALERLSDAIDHTRKLAGESGLHMSVKFAKDVGAAASLCSLIAVIATVIIVFWPYVELYT